MYIREKQKRPRMHPTYFNFDSEKLLGIAREAAANGIEMMIGLEKETVMNVLLSIFLLQL